MNVVRQRHRRGEGDRLRDEILTAARGLLIDTADPEAVSIRAIAHAVGVSAPSIYRHFADKDELVRAACDEAFAQFDVQVGAALAGGSDDPIDRILRIGRGYMKFGLEFPSLYRVLFMVLDPAEPMELDLVAHQPGIQTFGHLVAAIQDGIDKGVLQPGDAFAVACILWPAIHGLVSLRLSKPSFPWPDATEQLELLMNTCLQGLMAPK